MKWDLSKLYAGMDDPALAADLAAVSGGVANLNEYIASLGAPDADSLTEIISGMMTISSLFEKAAGMVMLTLAVEAENEAAQAVYSEINNIMVEYRQLMSAAANLIGRSSDIGAIIAGNPLLEEHEFVIRKLGERAAHTIDPALEGHILRMQINGGRAFEQLRDQLDATLLIDIETDGKVESLPLSAVRGRAYDPDMAVRERAYMAEMAAYPRIETPMAACLSAIKGEAIQMAGLMKYESPLEWTLAESNMDMETLSAMLTAMEEALPHFRRYMRAKAAALGYEGGLNFYDLFAPVGESTRKYSLEDARELLVEVLGGFNPAMGDMVSRAFDERWIDAYPQAGKQGGAFCQPMHPLGISYILSNFDGSLSSVLTLAHELGHAYHGECLKDSSPLNCDYPMPLAETASIFNETLMTQNLIAGASPGDKVMLVEQELAEATQVIVDIMSRYMFETEVFKVRKSRTMSARELCEMMLDAQRRTYGDGLNADCMHKYMWACKGHYYSTGRHFYNFPYAFGLLFAKGVYAIYEKKGAAFLPEYDNLLRMTAIADVRDVAASAGIDVRDKEFWRASLRVVTGEIDKFIQYVGEK